MDIPALLPFTPMPGKSSKWTHFDITPTYKLATPITLQWLV